MSIKNELLIDSLDYIDELEEENEMLETLLDWMEEELIPEQEESLEDFRYKGEQEDKFYDLSNCVRGLAKYLEEDENVYKAYQQKLKQIIKESVPAEVPKEYQDYVERYMVITSTRASHKFLDAFIEDVKMNTPKEEKQPIDYINELFN